MKFKCYRSAVNGRWYWHLKAENGEIVAQSEGYVNRADCLNAIRLVISTTPSTPVEVET